MKWLLFLWAVHKLTFHDCALVPASVLWGCLLGLKECLLADHNWQPDHNPSEKAKQAVFLQAGSTQIWHRLKHSWDFLFPKCSFKVLRYCVWPWNSQTSSMWYWYRNDDKKGDTPRQMDTWIDLWPLAVPCSGPQIQTSVRIIPSDTTCLLISFSLFSCAVLAFNGYLASPPSEVFTKGVIREAFGHCVSWTQTKSSKNKPSSIASALSFFSSWAKFSVEVHCLFLEGMTYNSREHDEPPRPPNILVRCCSAWSQHPTYEASLDQRTWSGADKGPWAAENDKESRRQDCCSQTALK